MKYLNLGCGNRYRSDWINIDFVSTGTSVKAHNLRSGIPLPDDSVDLVYCSHLLEHFSKREAPVFLAECQRVLRRRGIFRVVVPDLEGITSAYLKSLDEARAGGNEALARHEWMTIELLDQMVRDKSGGEMLEFLSRKPLLIKKFIIGRIGSEGKKIIDSISVATRDGVNENYMRAFGRFAISFLRSGKDQDSKEVAFRKSGEVHRWMYDSLSLARLLEQVGFKNIIQRTAFESYLSGWATYKLDTEQDGSIYKPDSLFMEGLKP